MFVSNLIESMQRSTKAPQSLRENHTLDESKFRILWVGARDYWQPFLFPVRCISSEMLYLLLLFATISLWCSHLSVRNDDFRMGKRCGVINENLDVLHVGIIENCQSKSGFQLTSRWSIDISMHLRTWLL